MTRFSTAAPGRLNRATLERAVRVLEVLVPEMLRIMIDAGPTVDWGEVCFPPREE